MVIAAARPSTKKRRVSISLSQEAWEYAQADMAARGFKSLSVYLDCLLKKRAEFKTWQDVLDETFGDKPMTDEERDWADRALGLKSPD